MGVTQFIPSYYEATTVAPDRAPRVGQLCRLPVPRLEEIPFVMVVDRRAPEEHQDVKYKLRHTEWENDFKPEDRLPIQSLRLRRTEELLIQRAKRRLAIVVGDKGAVFPDLAKNLRDRGQKHLQQRFILAVPMFGVEGPGHDGGFPPVMVARTRALLYPQFFYCPRHDSPFVYESIARLDRLQVVVPRVECCRAEPVALTKEALTLLRRMLRELLLGEDDEELGAMRELVSESLPADAQPAGQAEPAAQPR